MQRRTILFLVRDAGGIGNLLTVAESLAGRGARVQFLALGTEAAAAAARLALESTGVRSALEGYTDTPSCGGAADPFNLTAIDPVRMVAILRRADVVMAL